MKRKDKAMRVLIAEDEPTTRRILSGVLLKMGYEVIAAADGAEAWGFLQKPEAPKLLLIDWMMPQLDGLSLCRRIRETSACGYVYIIMVTARESRPDLLAGFEAGADDYIAKPVDPEELKARLRVGQRVLELEDAQKKAGLQLLQSEKMASVGQLAAGVAHEINNPTGFVSSNLKTLADYQADLLHLIDYYRRLNAFLEQGLKAGIDLSETGPMLQEIKAIEQQVDIDFILNDIPQLIEESREGTDRIKKIVLDLKDFAHPGADKICEVDINRGIKSTLNVVWNELKYKATVSKELGDIPKIQGYPQQLNQVFMNLLINAAQAIREKGEIQIRTLAVDGCVDVVIADNGIGIPRENLSKIFDPFFTTKEIGSGTGLGLHVVHNIVRKHGGSIAVKSEVGQGTEFQIRLPISMPSDPLSNVSQEEPPAASGAAGAA
jgi:two-component system NtrC family sensor kinase